MSFSQLKRSNSNFDVNLSPKAKKQHIDDDNTWLNNVSICSSVDLIHIENIQDTFEELVYFFNSPHYAVGLYDETDILLADAEADAFFLSDVLLTKDEEDTDKESDVLLAEDDENTDKESDVLLAEDDEDTDEDFFIYFLFDIQSGGRMEVGIDSDEACAVMILTNLK